MKVCFAYVGAEGSAHDSMVLQWSRFLDQVEDNFYVLVDAGYGLSKKVLTPYRSVRYHLKEWANGSGRPQSGKELYNLRHAKARNIVERVIGVLKRRFKVLRLCMDYEMIKIKAVIFACLCVHNFLREFDSSDLAEDFRDSTRNRDLDPIINDSDVPVNFDFSSGTSWREWMTAAMWTEYEEARLNRDDLMSDDEAFNELISDDESGTAFEDESSGSSTDPMLRDSDQDFDDDEFMTSVSERISDVSSDMFD